MEEDVFNRNNIDDIYNSSLNKHNLCLNKHIPMKNITVRSKDKVFMNNTIRKLMRKRNRLHHFKTVTDEEILDQINIFKYKQTTWY